MAVNGWGGDPDVLIGVSIGEDGPLDPPIILKAIFGHPTVFDVTSFAGVNYVQGDPGLTIRRGRSDEFDHFQAGTCTFTLRNNNREFDPSNESSPFHSILKPRRQVVVATARASDPGNTFTVLFVGVIDAWPETWTNTTGSVDIVAYDLLSVLAQSGTSPSLGVVILDDPLFGQLDRWQLDGGLPQQFTGDRIRSLVGFSGISSQNQSLATGVTEVLGLEPAGDLLSLCQESENAEAGFLFVDRQGTVVFYDRHSRFRNTRLATLQASFDDTQYSGLAVDFSTTQMFNDVRFTRTEHESLPEPATQTCTDETSIAEFGRKIHEETIPVTSDAEAFARADFWCDRYGIPKQRPSPFTMKMRHDVDDFFLKLARRELLDRLQVVRTPVVDIIDGGSMVVPPDVVDSGSAATPPVDIYDATASATVSFVGLLDQLEHRITKVEWDVTMAISPIDVDEAQNYLILNDATFGQLDEELLSY